MNADVDVMTDSGVDTQSAPAAMVAAQPLIWSVKRELWENRSIVFASLAIACVVQFGVLIATMMLPRRMPRILALDPVKQHEAITAPYSAIAGILIMTAFLVGVFYCLDALHGERRDRSILFWKSLPVSARTVLHATARFPLVVLPVIVFMITVVAQLIVLLLSTLVLLDNGPGLAAVWTNVKFFQSTIVFLYGLIAIALWHAPVYAWLLLVSGWARRAVVLWAVLPFLAAAALEKIVFETNTIF